MKSAFLALSTEKRCTTKLGKEDRADRRHAIYFDVFSEAGLPLKLTIVMPSA